MVNGFSASGDGTPIFSTDFYHRYAAGGKMIEVYIAEPASGNGNSRIVPEGDRRVHIGIYPPQQVYQSARLKGVERVIYDHF